MRNRHSTLGLVLLASALSLALLAQPAAATRIVAKDGKIHACMKVRGKGKGTLRVVRNRKVKCPHRWHKVAWYAAGVQGPAGAAGQAGAPGAAGEQGPRGEAGLPGRNENVVVNELEDKVTELLTRVEALEAILQGVTNQQLQEAIASIPVVQALCAQTEALTTNSNELGAAVGALNTILDTLLPTFSPVAVPLALPAAPCP
jgi:hypothetical protein